MNHLFRIFFVLSSVWLTGCGIGGFWMNGNPNPTPIKPYGAHWVKEGMTRESRRGDSWACGAAKTIHAADHVVFTHEEITYAKLPEDLNDILANSRLTKKWISCMQSKGYTYLEQCDARCLYP